MTVIDTNISSFKVDLTTPSRVLPESYRYGLYLNPKPDDPSVSELMEAADKAETLAKEQGPSTPVAVWDNRDNTVYLYLNNERFQLF